MLRLLPRDHAKVILQLTLLTAVWMLQPYANRYLRATIPAGTGSRKGDRISIVASISCHAHRRGGKPKDNNSPYASHP